MTRFESMTNPPTLGAGRRLAIHGPSIGTLSTGALPTLTATTGRPGEIQSASAWALTQTGAPPAGSVGEIYKGASAFALTSNTTPSGFQLVPSFAGIDRPYVMPFQNVKGPVNFQGIDDFWCWSFSAILAFDAMPGAVTGDVGIVLGVGTATTIRGGTLPGVELGPTGVGTTGVFVRQTNGGPVTFNQNVALPADMTEWHRYEIRLIGPTLTAEAQMKFIVDNTVVQTLAYGAGTVLGDQNPFGTNLGFTPGLINLSASAAGTVKMHVMPESLSLAAAPTELALP